MFDRIRGRMQSETSASEPGGRIGRETLLIAREFLKSLGQSAKLISLYAPEHPVPGASLQEAHRTLLTVFRKTDWSEFELALKDGRWLVNAAVLSDAAAAPQLLRDFFRAHHIHHLGLKRGTKLHELTTLCELIAMPESQRDEIVLEEYLERNGVMSIAAGTEEYTRQHKKKPAAAPPRAIPSPIPPPAARRPAGIQHPTGGGFGALIKSLVEESVADPEARAQIYGQTVKMVRQAIDQQVSKQTGVLRRQNMVVTNQRLRTEHVLQNVADGRIVVDDDGAILMMDRKAQEIFGRSLDEVAGRPLVEIVDGESQVAAISQNLHLPEDQRISENIRIAGDAEAMRVFRGSMAVVQDTEGRIVGTYAVMPHLTKYREAERKEEEFIAHVTHELKAPLSSICSALEIIAKMADSKFNDQERRFLDISRRNSEKLKSMIDEILDFSKINSGSMSVERVETKVDPILKEASDGLSPWASSKGIRLKAAACPPGLPAVLADHGRVVQIVTNLISNAIKSTPAKGEIVVSAETGRGEFEGSVVVSVRDSGTGIAPEDQERIFERFMQAPAVGEHREGVGLGLNIVKYLVSRHEGQLWLESEVGQGTTFHFSLPVA